MRGCGRRLRGAIDHGMNPLARLRERGWGRGALLLSACKIQSGFDRLTAAELLFSCVAKRKVTKRECHPEAALAGLLPGKSVRRGWAFRAGILPARKGEPIHGLARCAAWSSPPHRRPGAPEEQARIVRARSRSAGLRAVAVAVASVRWERAALPGAPMARRAGGGKSAGWLAGMRASFSPGQESRRKTPESAPHTEGRMPGGRAIGVPLSLVTFSRACERK